MSWNKTGGIAGKKFTSGGLDRTLAAGMVCHEAERLYPDMFKAVSIKAGVLTLAIQRADTIKVKGIEGPLVTTLRTYSTTRNLPLVERVKLIIRTEDTQ